MTSQNPESRTSALQVRRPGRIVEDSSFEILMEKSLTVDQDGETRALSAKEALQWKVYEDALAGKVAAVRKVLAMIQERDAARARAQAPRVKEEPVRKYQVEQRHMTSDQADAALLILGMARCEAMVGREEGARQRRMQLQPWAVQAALSRPGGVSLTAHQRQEVARQTATPNKIKWPKGYGA